MRLIAAFDAQNCVTQAVAAFFTQYDLLITPTLAQPPAGHGALDYHHERHSVESWLETPVDYAPFTALVNVSGQPAVNLPLGHSSAGVPIGVQLVAPYGREDLLIRLAARLEQAMPWSARTPALSVRSLAVPGAASATPSKAGSTATTSSNNHGDRTR